MALTSMCLLACDPANSLQNQEYRHYLDNFERWEISDVVGAFNHLDSKQGDFSCAQELEKAQRARWREKVGPVKAEQTPAGRALGGCLERYQESSGVGAGKLRAAVLRVWMNHNFLPAVEKAINDDVAAQQSRLDQAGCGGEQCQLLTVIGDLAVPRLGQKVSVAWTDARNACSRAGFGGLGPWRLPTRDDLVAMRKSGQLASDLDLATYWASTRELGASGQLAAYVLRFDLESLADDVEPKQVPFDRDGIPSLAKVRCVHDLDERVVETNEVAQMEKIIRAAGCPVTWEERLRVRGDLIVTWQQVVKAGENARSHCRELGWCGLTWKAAGRAETKLLGEDPWVGEGLDKRCVASVPTKND